MWWSFLKFCTPDSDVSDPNLQMNIVTSHSPSRLGWGQPRSLLKSNQYGSYLLTFLNHFFKSVFLSPASEGLGRDCYYRCLSVHRGGRRGGIVQSQALSQVSGPMSISGGTPVPGSFPGLWCQVLCGGTPLKGYPLANTGLGYSPENGVTPPPPPAGTGYPLPLLALGYHPWDRTAGRYASCSHTGELSCLKV